MFPLEQIWKNNQVCTGGTFYVQRTYDLWKNFFINYSCVHQDKKMYIWFRGLLTKLFRVIVDMESNSIKLTKK